MSKPHFLTNKNLLDETEYYLELEVKVVRLIELVI